MGIDSVMAKKAFLFLSNSKNAEDLFFNGIGPEDTVVFYDRFQQKNASPGKIYKNCIYVEDIERDSSSEDIGKKTVATATAFCEYGNLSANDSFDTDERAALALLGLFRFEFILYLARVIHHIRIFKKLEKIFKGYEVIIALDASDYRHRLAGLIFENARFIFFTDKSSILSFMKPRLKEMAQKCFSYLLSLISVILWGISRGKPKVIFSGNTNLFGSLARRIADSGSVPAFVVKKTGPKTAIFCLKNRFLFMSVRDTAVKRPDTNVLLKKMDSLISLNTVFEDSGLVYASSVREDLLKLLERSVEHVSYREQLSDLFKENRIRSLFVDEDVIAFNKLLVQVARANGVKSHVVQHGMPCNPLSFVPLSADLMLSIGASSTDKFRNWGIDSEKIMEIGMVNLSKAPQGASVRERLKIPGDKKIVTIFAYPVSEPYGYNFIYSPLFSRGHMAKVLKALKDASLSIRNTVVILKPHPNDASGVASACMREDGALSSRVILAENFSAAELISASDLVLSGLSTVYWECINSNIPCLIYLKCDALFSILDDFIIDPADRDSDFTTRIKDTLCNMSVRAELLKKMASEKRVHISDNISDFVKNMEYT